MCSRWLGLDMWCRHGLWHGILGLLRRIKKLRGHMQIVECMCWLALSWLQSMSDCSAKSMFIGSPYNVMERKSVGFSLGAEPTHHTQIIRILSTGTRKALLDWTNFSILWWSNFQLLYKRINYQYLTFFDQIESLLQLFLCEAPCIVRY